MRTRIMLYLEDIVCSAVMVDSGSSTARKTAITTMSIMVVLFAAPTKACYCAGVANVDGLGAACEVPYNGSDCATGTDGCTAVHSGAGSWCCPSCRSGCRSRRGWQSLFRQYIDQC